MHVYPRHIYVTWIYMFSLSRLSLVRDSENSWIVARRYAIMPTLHESKFRVACAVCYLKALRREYSCTLPFFLQCPPSWAQVSQCEKGGSSFCGWTKILSCHSNAYSTVCLYNESRFTRANRDAWWALLVTVRDILSHFTFEYKNRSSWLTYKYSWVQLNNWFLRQETTVVCVLTK